MSAGAGRRGGGQTKVQRLSAAVDEALAGWERAEARAETAEARAETAEREVRQWRSVADRGWRGVWVLTALLLVVLGVAVAGVAWGQSTPVKSGFVAVHGNGAGGGSGASKSGSVAHETAAAGGRTPAVHDTARPRGPGRG